MKRSVAAVGVGVLVAGLTRAAHPDTDPFQFFAWLVIYAVAAGFVFLYVADRLDGLR